MPTTKDDDKELKDAVRDAMEKDNPKEGASSGGSRGFGGIGEALARGISEGVSKMSRGAMETGLGIDREGGNDKAAPLIPASDVRPSAASFGQTPDQVTPAYDPDNPVKLRKVLDPVSVAKVIPSLVSGNLPGAAMAAAKVKTKTEWDTWNTWNNDPRNELDGSKKDTAPATITPTPPVVPVTPEPEEVAPVSEFTTKARRKKGYQSTILGGGVAGAFPQGKTLLGA